MAGKQEQPTGSKLPEWHWMSEMSPRKYANPEGGLTNAKSDGKVPVPQALRPETEASNQGWKMMMMCSTQSSRGGYLEGPRCLDLLPCLHGRLCQGGACRSSMMLPLTLGGQGALLVPETLLRRLQSGTGNFTHFVGEQEHVKITVKFYPRDTKVSVDREKNTTAKRLQRLSSSTVDQMDLQHATGRGQFGLQIAAADPLETA